MGPSGTLVASDTRRGSSYAGWWLTAYCMHTLEKMPHDLPPWGTVWWYFRKWRKDGTWEQVEGALRPMVRESEGRDATPSGAIIDSQSVKTTEKPGL